MASIVLILSSVLLYYVKNYDTIESLPHYSKSLNMHLINGNINFVTATLSTAIFNLVTMY